jgi:hypothetical protein
MKASELVETEIFDGGRARIRQVCDGRFIAEVVRGALFPKWHGVDLRSSPYCWDKENGNYRDCIGTQEECLKALALRGISPNTDQTRGGSYVV